MTPSASCPRTATGLGAWWQIGESAPRRARVSQVERLEDAMVCTTSLNNWREAGKFETFQRIKEQLQDNGIPIFIMTALNRKPWFADLEAEGAVILQKLFEIDQFLRLVDDMLL